jgi:hypothetical protein
MDVRDTEYIWCVGRVLIAYDKSLLIHYEGWHKQYDENIMRDSPRLACLGFYTKRLDVPMYVINGDNNCLCYLQIPEVINVYKNFTLPLIDTVDEFFKYENSKVCD